MEHCTEAGGGALYCLEALCGPNLPNGYPANGTGYYLPCNSSGMNDGTCIPVPDPAFGTVGICLQAGTAPLAGPCDLVRDDAGTASQCPFDTICFSSNGNSLCANMCAAIAYPGEFDGGATSGSFTGTCAASETCLDFTDGVYYFWGCLLDCEVGGSRCPTPLLCAATSGGDDAGVCIP